ncbi:MAG: lactate utilization protein [Oscillospiraceae bacterium]|nr:lactate utilization protein [Oscillospiraceae bacterium]
MTEPMKKYYEKRAQVLVKNLKSRHFDAYYCETCDQALEKALSLIPEGASVGWGGAMSAEQIGLLDAVRSGNYTAIDRDTAQSPAQRVKLMKQALLADVFIAGANALSMDGQMVSIDGNGNRVAAIVYGPDSVIIIAGINKAVDTLEDAVRRARTVAAPANKQRFNLQTPCEITGVCANCKSENSICNQILITRNSKPAGRIKVIVVGQELGL